MNIGKLNKRIDLLEPITKDDEWGGQNTRWEFVGRVWAQVYQTNYKEQEALGTPMSHEQFRLKIRHREDIRRGWLIRLHQQEFLVQDVDNTYVNSTILIVRRYESGV